MANLSNEISKLCLDKYKSLGKSGKPSEKEWTILSGIVLKDSNEKLNLVALATGTKCLGGSQLAKLKSEEIGSRLSDSHAEILARRAFLRYLYEQLDLLLSNTESEVFSMDNNKEIKIRDGISFHFFTSQTPCGDCSIFLKENSKEDEPPTKIRKANAHTEEIVKDSNGVNNEEDQIARDIYRTGAKCVETESNKDPHLPGINYHVVGPLRTKPGRGDPTLSLSCSDKIAKWNILGLQGSLLSILIPKIKMESVTVGGGCPFSQEAMERGLYKRFQIDNSELLITQANLCFPYQKSSERTHPCPSSIIWCNVRERNTEVAVEGRKQGATKKKGGNYLLVSRRGLFEAFLMISDKYKNPEFYNRHPKKITYLDCKQWSVNYQHNWATLKSTVLCAWPSKPLQLQQFVL